VKITQVQVQAGFNVEALKVEVMHVSLVREGLPVPQKGVSAPALAAKLQAHFESGRADLVRCDTCNGLSPNDLASYPSCPFCGSSEPIAADGAPAQAGAEATGAPSAAVVPFVPSEVVGAPAEVEADVRKLDDALARAQLYRQEMKGAGWDLGNALREIEEKKLYLARRDGKGVPVHPTFDQFCEREFGCSGRWARSMIDVAREFTREQAMDLGPRKLTPLLRLGAAEKQEMIARLPEMTQREVDREVQARTADKPRRATAREGAAPVPTDGHKSRREAIRAEFAEEEKKREAIRDFFAAAGKDEREEEIVERAADKFSMSKARVKVALKEEARKDPKFVEQVAKKLGTTEATVKVALRASKAERTSTKDLPTRVDRGYPPATEQGGAVEKSAVRDAEKAGTAPAKPKRLTVIALEGRSPVPLYARRKKPSDNERAQSLADEPQGRLRMLNGTEMRFTVRMGAKGLVLDVVVAESVDPAAV